MSEYLLTAIGIIFLAAIIGFIVPDGKLKKSINFSLRIICICVLVQPLTNVFSLDETDDDVNVDYGYICEAYSSAQSDILEETLSEQFGREFDCEVLFIYDEGKIKENGVNVWGSFDESVTIQNMTEYLSELGYINITVNEKA